MAFNVSKIASARASLTISLTKSLRVAGPLGLVRVLKSVYGSQLGQPRCHLGFTHAIVYGQATTS